MKKKLLSLIFTLVIILMSGITAYADGLDSSELKEVLPVEEVSYNVSDALSDNERGDLDSVTEELKSGEKADAQNAALEIQENNTLNAVNCNDQSQMQSCGAYSLKFSLTGSEVNPAEFAGGSEDGIAVADILKALGADISENSIIEYKEESVDTEFIRIKETENGLFLTDNGHFEKTTKPLIVLVDGVEFVIDVTDPKNFWVSSSGNDTSDGNQIAPYMTIQKAIDEAGSEETTIQLLSDISENITINSSQKITLDLNGHILRAKETGNSIITVFGELTIIDSNPSAINGAVSGGGITGGNCNNGAGSAVYVGDSATFNMYGGTIYGNTAKDGTVAIGSGTFNMHGGTITKNKATSKGGGVFNTGTFKMYGGTISGNTSLNGGGVYNSKINGNKCVFEMADGIISGNTAKKDGVAGGQGGGVYNIGLFTFTSGSISENKAEQRAGGVYNEQSAVFTMSGGTISKNISENEGGGVCNKESTFTMTNGTISQNSAGKDGGGGVCNDRGNFTFEGGTICNNTSTLKGGGVSNNSTFNMNGGTISGNSATENGGGVNNEGSGVFTMTNGTISDNSAGTKGGGVYNQSSCKFNTSGGTISDNSAASEGGGVYSGIITVGGTANIINNKAANSANNVYLIGTGKGGVYPKTLTIGQTPESSMKIGVTTLNSPTESSKIDITDKKTNTSVYAKHFISDNPNYLVLGDDTEKNIKLCLTPTSGAAIIIETGSIKSTVQGAVDEAQSGYTVRLLLDSTENVTIDASKTVKLDLGGHTLKAASGTVIINNGALTLDDSVGGGMITGCSTGVEHNGNDLILSGKASVTGNTQNIYLPDGKKITVSDGYVGKAGVTTEVEPTEDNLIPVTNECTSPDKYLQCFFSDKDSFMTVIDDKAIKLAVAPPKSAEEVQYDAIVVVSTDEKGKIAHFYINSKIADIYITDKSGNKTDAINVKILKPWYLISNGAETAIIRMNDTLDLALDIRSAICGKEDCIIIIDCLNGIIKVSCDGKEIFSADISDIIDRVSKVTYDGKTAQAIDAQGKVIKEFDIN